MNKKGIKRIVDIFVKIISYICMAILFFIAAFLLFYIISNEIALRNGSSPIIKFYTIVSPSMEPNINVYDIVISKRVENEKELEVGDVINFYSDTIDTGGYTITHRIIETYEQEGITYYVTKGDNNQSQDAGDITISNIVGKVFFVIPALGRVQYFIASKLGWILIILIPAMGIILYDIVSLIKIYRIKNEIEEIPKLKEVDKIREKEEDKEIRGLIEKAGKINKRENEKERKENNREN